MSDSVEEVSSKEVSDWYIEKLSSSSDIFDDPPTRKSLPPARKRLPPERGNFYVSIGTPIDDSHSLPLSMERNINAAQKSYTTSSTEQHLNAKSDKTIRYESPLACSSNSKMNIGSAESDYLHSTGRIELYEYSSVPSTRLPDQLTPGDMRLKLGITDSTMSMESRRMSIPKRSMDTARSEKRPELASTSTACSSARYASESSSSGNSGITEKFEASTSSRMPTTNREKIDRSTHDMERLQGKMSSTNLSPSSILRPPPFSSTFQGHSVVSTGRELSTHRITRTKVSGIVAEMERRANSSKQIGAKLAEKLSERVYGPSTSRPDQHDQALDAGHEMRHHSVVPPPHSSDELELASITLPQGDGETHLSSCAVTQLPSELQGDISGSSISQANLEIGDADCLTPTSPTKSTVEPWEPEMSRDQLMIHHMRTLQFDSARQLANNAQEIVMINQAEAASIAIQAKIEDERNESARRAWLEHYKSASQFDIAIQYAANENDLAEIENLKSGNAIPPPTSPLDAMKNWFMKSPVQTN